MPEEALEVIGLKAEVDLETEDLQEVIKGIGQGLMGEEVLVVQVRIVEEPVLTGQDIMEEAVPQAIGQKGMEEAALLVTDQEGMEDHLEEGIDYISLLNWS